MLDRKKKYLQVALNSTLSDARDIIDNLPVSDRILIEAGTPLIKQYGMRAVSELLDRWQYKTYSEGIQPYIVADVKTMDRGETEVAMAKEAGASALIALGQAPLETVNSFIQACEKNQVDSMVDMMNVDQPIKVLRRLRKLPTVVVLHICLY